MASNRQLAFENNACIFLHGRLAVVYTAFPLKPGRELGARTWLDEGRFVREYKLYLMGSRGLS